MPETVATTEAGQFSVEGSPVASTGALETTTVNTANTAPGTPDVTVIKPSEFLPQIPNQAELSQPELSYSNTTSAEPSRIRKAVTTTGKNALAAAKWTGLRAKEAVVWTGETLKRAREVMNTPTAKAALNDLIDLGLEVLTEPYIDRSGRVDTERFAEDLADDFEKSPTRTVLKAARQVAPAVARYAGENGRGVVAGVRSDLRRGNG